MGATSVITLTTVDDNAGTLSHQQLKDFATSGHPLNSNFGHWQAGYSWQLPRARRQNQATTCSSFWTLPGHAFRARTRVNQQQVVLAAPSGQGREAIAKRRHILPELVHATMFLVLYSSNFFMQSKFIYHAGYAIHFTEVGAIAQHQVSSCLPRVGAATHSYFTLSTSAGSDCQGHRCFLSFY